MECFRRVQASGDLTQVVRINAGSVCSGKKAEVG